MPWVRIVLAGLAATVVSSLTDWFFFGYWMHERYMTYPEVWRDPSGGSEPRMIAYSIALSAVSGIALVALCVWSGRTRWSGALAIAGAVWLIAVVPLQVEQMLFIKIDLLLLVPSLLGWLVKLAWAAAAAVLLVERVRA